MGFAGRLRGSLAREIGAVFVALLLVVSAAVVLVIRHLTARDLEESVRRDLMHAMDVLESDLAKQRHDLFLLAQLAARAAQVYEQTADVGAVTLQITLLEQARSQGIDMERFVLGDPGTPDWPVLRRAFAGVPTVDFVAEGEGSGRLHQIAVVPLGALETDRKVVATASVSLGREFLRREREKVGGDVSLFLREGFVASSSVCRQCTECIARVIYGKGEWAALEAGRRLYFTFDCEPEPEAALAVPAKTFDGKTVVFVVSRSRLPAREALFHATLGLLGGTLLFTAAMGVAFFLLTSRALRPLREMTALARGISEGRYGETIPVPGHDEVSDLAEAFNRMSTSLAAAMREISEWNRLLEKRVEEKTEELERVHRKMIEVEKLAAMGQLAAGVAHEINNPLSGILGYAEIALELYGSRPPAPLAAEEAGKLVSYFRHIEGLSQRCRAIVMDMLKFARHHTEEDRLLDLNQVVRQTLVFLGKQFDRGRVVVREEFAPDLPPVRGNALQLQQVFTNLALNAAQAMPGGGTLTVRTRAADSTVEAEFADTGTGIEPEHLHRIFEPFFTTKPAGEGTGLGLSVSYGIVKRHGGEIRVASEPGKGASFTVVLPRDGERAPDADGTGGAEARR